MILSIISSIYIAILFAVPEMTSTNKMNASEVIEAMKSNLTCTWRSETVDTFKSGDPFN
jgi:hypothetical protein